jgi:hypothetical protein
MRGQPPPLAVLLVAAGLSWVAWSVARDLRRMHRTGIAHAKYGPTVRREKEPGRFQRRLIANVVLLLFVVVLIVAGVVSAGRDLLGGRGYASPKDGGFESRSNSGLERPGSTPAAQPDR